MSRHCGHETTILEDDGATEVARKRQAAKQKEEVYYTMRKGYSGTDKQTGPLLDLRL